MMEVTETAVEGGVANKKKVKRVGKEKALGRQVHGKDLSAEDDQDYVEERYGKGFRELGSSFWTKRWTQQLMKKEEKTLNWMHKKLPTPRLILLRIRVGDFLFPGSWLF